MPTSDPCRHPASLTADTSAVDFLTLVCHELRTPLQTILGQSELLLRDATDETARARLAAIEQHGALMLRLVNDLLDWRAIESGEFRLVVRPVDLSALVAQTVASCRPAAAAKGLALQCHIAPDAPTWVRLDGDRVRQVLLNLLGNAIKFTVRGRIDVTLRSSADRRGRAREALLRVADSGPGIARGEQRRIFRPFVRLEQTATVEGAGLGLALTARLCRRLGGALAVESDGRTGATFTARLVAPAALAPMGTVATQASTPLCGRRVLIADDNPLVRELFVAHLGRMGAHCEPVADGGQALARALSGDFAVVVLDLSMPGLDGFEVARRLRARRVAGLRIVGASAHGGATERTRALAAGMDAFLTKPVELAALTAALGWCTPDIGRAADAVTRTALRAQFRREARRQGAALGDAWRRRDWAELERQAHYVHNSACVVGDDALGAACVRLKQAAIDGDECSARSSWRRCEAAFARWTTPRVRVA